MTDHTALGDIDQFAKLAIVGGGGSMAAGASMHWPDFKKDLLHFMYSAPPIKVNDPKCRRRFVHLDIESYDPRDDTGKLTGTHAHFVIDEYAFGDDNLGRVVRRYFPLPAPEDETNSEAIERHQRRANGKMNFKDRRDESRDAKAAMRERALSKLKKKQGR